MSLSTAMKTAQSSFSNTALQTAVVSKNIANASNTTYARRAAMLATAANGATVVEIQRAQNESLQKQNLLSISQSNAQDTLLAGLQRMKTFFGGDDYELSAATYITKLRDNLETFANKPSERSLAETVVADAVDVANALNSQTKAVQEMRAEADADIAASVTELNRLLAEFKTYNDQVKQGTAAGTDVNDALDQRDRLLTQISAIVGVSSNTRTHNDMVLYTSDGTVLFETNPRTVTFTPTPTYGPTTAGNSVRIDGVAIEPGVGGNTSGSGTIAALLQVRDEVAPAFQKQLDETARGLITMFEDAGMPGLFTWMDGATESNVVPGGLTNGLAGAIIVNPDVITAKGGNPMLIRDGINASQNPDGDASYSTLLNSYLGKFDTNLTFDGTTGLDTSMTILEYSTASIGWVEQLRSAATTASEDKGALWSRTEEALYSVTAVSLDEELSLLLDLEHSQKATAKLVTTVDEMMTALLNAAS
ncbi:flagellar hook-associated protein FlgK [Ferirhizobium litorale]|uniref:Flagellar hook-associated protein 1 n=1 Tax=Ferirhizobium litorale TaxID=2927786 RepID=A0AAE3QE30_9HYPH|nr:flagellar hook-associated protein FlgK [Fererhizobium litorale]MDI7922305.1 flagellar hook-associated protein FlgK [Fererhizobium litorale]